VPRRKFVVPLLVALFVVALLLLPALSRLITEWWWFKEVGYEVVFAKELVTRFGLFLAAGFLTTGVLHLNLRAAQRGVVTHPVLRRVGEALPSVNVPVFLRSLSLPVAIGFGLLGGLAGSSVWDTVLQATQATPFGVSDPIFGRDISWYVFTLPAIEAIIGLLFGLVMLTLLFIVPLYFLRGDIISRPPTIRLHRPAGMHIAILLAVMLVLTAIRLWVVDVAGLLWSGRATPTSTRVSPRFDSPPSSPCWPASWWSWGE